MAGNTSGPWGQDLVGMCLEGAGGGEKGREVGDKEIKDGKGVYEEYMVGGKRLKRLGKMRSSNSFVIR